MALNYNLKYKKQNAFSKVLLEKEGEIVIDRQSFRLKGKGAQDQGEMIFFAEIKEFWVADEGLQFLTFSREKYTLNGFQNLFDSFLKDFFRVKNEFLADSLFMKVGMLMCEYDGFIESTFSSGKALTQGKSRIQFYEGSILILPEKNDCMVFYFNFLKSHEFDEDEYVLKLTDDKGTTVTISKLGTAFMDVQSTLENLLGKMYEKVVHHLQEILPDFDAVTLLKLAFLMRDCKCVPLTALKKIHENLPNKIEALAFQQSKDLLLEKVKFLRTQSEDRFFNFGFSISSRMDSRDLQIKSWFLITLPRSNIAAFAMSSQPNDNAVYFFSLGHNDVDIEEKNSAQMHDLNQVMFLFRSDTGPIYKDKLELKRTKYRTALRKLSSLRLLRKLYLGKSYASDIATFQRDVEKFGKAAMNVNVLESREERMQKAAAI